MALEEVELLVAAEPIHPQVEEVVAALALDRVQVVDQATAQFFLAVDPPAKATTAALVEVLALHPSDLPLFGAVLAAVVQPQDLPLNMQVATALTVAMVLPPTLEPLHQYLVAAVADLIRLR